MGTSLRETAFDGAQAVALDRPLLTPARVTPLGLSRRAAVAIATAGRFGVVWLPIYALVVGRLSSLPLAIGVATALAAVWTLALVRTFATARLTLLSLGAAPAAALGTAGGLVCVSAVALWASRYLSIDALSPRVTLEMAAAVFVFSALWEGLVHRSLAG